MVDEAHWHYLPAADVLAVQSQRWLVSSERWLATHLLRWVTVSAVSVSLVAGTAFSPTLQTRLRTHTAIQATLQLEKQAWQGADSTAVQRLIDSQVKPNLHNVWRTPREHTSQPIDFGATLLTVAPLGELVQVKLLVTRPTEEWWRSYPYRETRFYRQSNQGWVRTTPTSELWGTTRSLETPHLRFEFSAHDAAAVLPIMERMEVAYLQAHEWLDLPAPANTPKVTFAVVPETVREWGPVGERQLVSSPALTKVPAGLSDADYLAHVLASRFSYQVINQALTGTEYRNSYHWRPLLWAVSGWLRTELLTQRSPWHQQAEDIFRQRLPERLPLQLMAASESAEGQPASREEFMWRYMIAESVVAYVMHTQGKEQFPAFVQAMAESRAWTSFIEQFFHQSVEEFEKGWNQFLSEHYR
jgi:hypothetical protein